MLGRPCRVLSVLGERLGDMGIEVDRISSGISILDPDYQGEGIIWERGIGPRMRYFLHTPEMDESYNQSLWRHSIETGQMIRHKFGQHDEYDRLKIIQELDEEGYTEYVSFPMTFSDGAKHGLAFASRSKAGFKDDDIRVFEELSNPLSLICELFNSRQASESILNTYLGTRAGRRVMSGEIQRGDGEHINAIVAFCDIRNFTGFSNYLPDKSLLQLLNEYFGVVTSRVEQHGGEILKFIGDEVLAVFPYTNEQSARIAAFEAMAALRKSLKDLCEANARGLNGLPAIHVGMGVHSGRVFFGNVGGERRLDFTVVGPVVNEAARIADLSKRLDHTMLISDTVAEILDCDEETCVGTFPLKGFPDPVKVYRAPELTRSCAFGPGNTAFLACEKN
ncbi:Adenylate cyclase 1 [Pseudovibrio axinellae]|uniref:Adenylate cyclase 1 n=2 Tax=Pseudovibrio axinellae TaxID=989403 RepID=A0A161UZR6_9HYPH|nr:Adenylate cyclase 1 [Pseudovibrio axinellae]SER62519.1 adenylate cyclase [Pseudovibrio axinellae]